MAIKIKGNKVIDDYENITVDGTADIGGNTDIGGTLAVSGASTLSSTLWVGNTLTVSKSINSKVTINTSSGYSNIIDFSHNNSSEAKITYSTNAKVLGISALDHNGGIRIGNNVEAYMENNELTIPGYGEGTAAQRAGITITDSNQVYIPQLVGVGFAQPFMVYKTQAQQMDDNQWEKITWDVDPWGGDSVGYKSGAFDRGDNFNFSGDKWICPEDGIWMFGANIASWGYDRGTESMHVKIDIEPGYDIVLYGDANDMYSRNPGNSANTEDHTFNVTGLRYVEKGAEVSVWFYSGQNSGDTSYVGGPSGDASGTTDWAKTDFWGYMVAPGKGGYNETYPDSIMEHGQGN